MPPKRVRSGLKKHSYSDVAHQYARDIVSGRIVACKFVIQACQRHLDGLAKAKSKDYPYVFDLKKAAAVCRFIEHLPHTKGKWARSGVGESNRIKLEAWQIFIVCNLFGWVWRSSGLRKYREAYIEVPRKNAKSTLAAAIDLYMLVADGEFGAEVYSGATTERQAMEVFGTARRMVMNTPEIQHYFGVTVASKGLFVEEDGSRFVPVVGNPGDGSSPSSATNDEFHEHLTPLLHDTFKTGMGAREQPLLKNITTAGSLIDGPCHLMRQDCQKILEGRIEDESFFCIMYTVDADIDWKSELALRMANPNYGVSVFESFLKEQQAAAIQSSHKQNVFKTKHLNVWVNAATGWMNMAAWDACKDPSLDLEQFLGKECFEGDDLGRKIDLASRAKLFKRLEDGRTHYYYFGRHYVPKDRAMDGDHSHYEKWVHDGNLVAIDGPEIKLGVIQREIKADFAKFDMQCVAFDPWAAQQMQQNLEEEFGDDIILTIDQTTKNLSDAMKEVEAAVLSGRFHHDGDPVMSWAMSNVIAKEDANENVFPRKESHGKNKIDPVSALLNAMNRAYATPLAAPSVYEERGILTL